MFSLFWDRLLIAKDIIFAINNLSQNKENNIYNCSEDCEILASDKSVSNKNLKAAGFIFLIIKARTKTLSKIQCLYDI